jgi:hypothetical protein
MGGSSSVPELGRAKYSYLLLWQTIHQAGSPSLGPPRRLSTRQLGCFRPTEDVAINLYLATSTKHIF